VRWRSLRRQLSDGVLICGVLLTAGCGGTPSPTTSSVAAELSLDPSPPVVGDSSVSLRLSDADGDPLPGAAVRLEGNMNHAGMKPSFADLRESAPGRYTGTLEFTMGGDWFVLVTAKMPSGASVQRKIDVPGVRAP